jgi:hypothetical protein
MIVYTRYRMNHKFLSVALIALLTLAACADERVKVQKSPCVGIDGSPCGPKRTPTGNPLGVG